MRERGARRSRLRPLARGFHETNISTRSSPLRLRTPRERRPEETSDVQPVNLSGLAWSEPLGPDPSRLVSGLHQKIGRGLDEPVRTADVRAAVGPSKLRD